MNGGTIGGRSIPGRLPRGFSVGYLTISTTYDKGPKPVRCQNICLLAKRRIFRFNPICKAGGVKRFLTVIRTLTLVGRGGVDVPICSSDHGTLD